MPEAKIEMSVRRASPTVSVIDITGEVTAFAEPVLTQAFEEAAGDGVDAVVLNFADMDYMNSGGIGLLVTTLIRANRNNQQMRAFGLTEHYRQILSLTRLDEAIAIFDDESAAVGAG
jgi:anti-sigma B factor antagonist